MIPATYVQLRKEVSLHAMPYVYFHPVKYSCQLSSVMLAI